MGIIDELEKVINSNYSMTIETENLKGKEKLIGEKINKILTDFQKYRKSNLKFKSILMQDIEKITDTLEQIAGGNFNVKLPELQLLELANISYGIEQLIGLTEKLKASLDEIAGIITELVSSSNEISSVNEEIIVKAKEDIRLTSEASTSTTELTASLQQISHNSDKVSKSAEETLSITKEGYETIRSITDKIEDSNKLIKESGNSLMELSKRSEAIGEFLHTIAKIAEKSDLLALNAAIEAAGIGQAGRRFRVVAEEMRRFANNTIGFSNQIENVLSEIVNQINNSVSKMEITTHHFEEISSDILSLKKKMERIVKVFEETATMMKEISISISQQSKAIDVLRNVVENTNISANETLKAIEGSHAVLLNLTEIVKKLENIIKKFKLEEE